MRRFLLADDHSIVRMGIKMLIERAFGNAETLEAENGRQIIEILSASPVDLIMLDINFPDCDFSSLMNWIKVRAKETEVLVFTAYSEEVYGVRSIQMGASGFLNKNAPDSVIIQAINRVLDQKKYISPQLAELLLAQHSGNGSSNPFKSLSAREMEIVLFLHQGKSLKEICQLLHIQYSTANTYKRRIFEKLNVFTIMALAKLMDAYKIGQ